MATDSSETDQKNKNREMNQCRQTKRFVPSTTAYTTVAKRRCNKARAVVDTSSVTRADHNGWLQWLVAMVGQTNIATELIVTGAYTPIMASVLVSYR